jgi:hypothetical protein
MHQVINLRTGDGPACEALNDRQQRRDYLERKAAAQRAMTSRYAVTLGCSLPLPDGRLLGSLEPVDLAALSPHDARALLASGVVMESLTWPAEPRQPWE